MNLTTPKPRSSAERWGPLWGSRAADWADNEAQQLPTYEAAIAQVGIDPGDRVLDLGCGSGVFLRAAAARGALVAGLDASEALIELARARVPGADLRVGPLEQLPYPDDRFDLVAGFNSFFFAEDMTVALREAGRVARPGAPVVIQVWGRPEACDLEPMKSVTRRFMPPPAANAPSPFELSRPGVLEALATAAGLEPGDVFDVSWAYEYGDEDELARGMLAPAGVGDLVGIERQAELRAAIVEALASRRAADGSYRLNNEFHFLIASA